MMVSNMRNVGHWKGLQILQLVPKNRILAFHLITELRATNEI